jgi:hypothetical protein
MSGEAKTAPSEPTDHTSQKSLYEAAAGEETSEPAKSGDVGFEWHGSNLTMIAQGSVVWNPKLYPYLAEYLPRFELWVSAMSGYGKLSGLKPDTPLYNGAISDIKATLCILFNKVSQESKDSSTERKDGFFKIEEVVLELAFLLPQEQTTLIIKNSEDFVACLFKEMQASWSQLSVSATKESYFPFKICGKKLSDYAKEANGFTDRADKVKYFFNSLLAQYGEVAHREQWEKQQEDMIEAEHVIAKISMTQSANEFAALVKKLKDIPRTFKDVDKFPDVAGKVLLDALQGTISLSVFAKILSKDYLALCDSRLAIANSAGAAVKDFRAAAGDAAGEEDDNGEDNKEPELVGFERFKDQDLLSCLAFFCPLGTLTECEVDNCARPHLSDLGAGGTIHTKAQFAFSKDNYLLIAKKLFELSENKTYQFAGTNSVSNQEFSMHIMCQGNNDKVCGLEALLGEHKRSPALWDSVHSDQCTYGHFTSIIDAEANEIISSNYDPEDDACKKLFQEMWDEAIAEFDKTIIALLKLYGCLPVMKMPKTKSNKRSKSDNDDDNEAPPPNPKHQKGPSDQGGGRGSGRGGTRGGRGGIRGGRGGHRGGRGSPGRGGGRGGKKVSFDASSSSSSSSGRNRIPTTHGSNSYEYD